MVDNLIINHSYDGVFLNHNTVAGDVYLPEYRIASGNREFHMQLKYFRHAPLLRSLVSFPR